MGPNLVRHNAEIAHRARWYISLRWFLLAAVSLPNFFLAIANKDLNNNTKLTILFFTVAVASNILFFLLVRTKGTVFYYRVLAAAILSFDIVLISVLIFIKGGLESRSVILYEFPILAAAPMFGSVAAYFAASVAVVCYDTQVLLDYYNKLKPLDINSPTLHQSATYIVETIAYISSVLILSALIADYITRKLIEKERQATENLIGLNKAQLIAKMGSWEWDVKTNRVTYSDGLYALLNLKHGIHENQKFALLKYIHPDDRARVKRVVETAIRQGRPYRYEARLDPQSTLLKYIQCEGEPVLDKAGKVIKLYGAVHDITDIKQLEVAKTDFVAIASHQLRTPASSVKQYIGMMLGGYAGMLSDVQVKMLQSAYESNERQIIIVNDLLYVAQLDSGNLHLKPEVIDLIALLRSVIEDIAPRYVTSRQRIILSTRFRHLSCKVDPSLLRMVIENLVDNARKYSPPDETIKVQLIRNDSHVRITVTDNGVGIAHEDMNKLFHKFTRIENPLSAVAGGSGLGLYLSQKLIMMHGGKIEVSSTVGKGSRFTALLPGSLVAQKGK